MKPHYPEADSEREIILTRLLQAPRSLVFEAWTQPEHLNRWFGPRGFTNTFHEVAVQPGGTWRFTMHGPDGTDYPNIVVFDEVVAPSKLVYRQGGTSPDEPGSFVTTVTFEEQGKATLLTLRMLFRSREDRDYVIEHYGAVEGGRQTLDRLEETLAYMKAGEVFRSSRTVKAPVERVWEVWTDSDHLAKWWGPRGFKVFSAKMDLKPGGAFHYGLKSPEGMEIWGKFIYRHLHKPNEIIYLSGFSDAEGGLCHHPMVPTFPLLTFNTMTLSPCPEGTLLELVSVPWQATAEQIATFESIIPSMQEGYRGTFEQMQDYLKGKESGPKA